MSGDKCPFNCYECSAQYSILNLSLNKHIYVYVLASSQTVKVVTDFPNLTIAALI